jgi:Tfp pilus assembly protein FimT
MKTKNYKTKKYAGYTTLELLFYIGIFVVMSLLVVNAMITMAKSFRETSVQAELLQGGTIMERISRDVRQANGINTITASTLKLDTKDNVGAGKTIEFRLVGTDIQFLEDDVLTGNLNAPNILVTGLVFTQINTAASTGVKVQVSMSSVNDSQARVQDFYDTVILRGSY